MTQGYSEFKADLDRKRKYPRHELPVHVQEFQNGKVTKWYCRPPEGNEMYRYQITSSRQTIREGKPLILRVYAWESEQVTVDKLQAHIRRYHVGGIII